MKYLLAVASAVFFATHVMAQNDPNSAMVYFQSCMAAADIVQGKRPAADSEDASKQLRQAAICFGAVTAIVNLEPLFKAEYSACPPPDKKISAAQAVLAVRPISKAIRSRWQTIFINSRPQPWPFPGLALSDWTI
jgi:hypothetical protein